PIMSKLTFPTSRFLATSAVLALTTAFTLSACAPPQPPPKEAEDISPDGPLEGVEAEATSSNDAPEPAGDEPAVEFDAMSPPEKIQYMKTTVAPRMKLVFQEHDAEEFAEFSCATCHGPGAKDGNFSMPTDSLPALDKEETE